MTRRQFLSGGMALAATPSIPSGFGVWPWSKMGTGLPHVAGTRLLSGLFWDRDGDGIEVAFFPPGRRWRVYFRRRSTEMIHRVKSHSPDRAWRYLIDATWGRRDYPDGTRSYTGFWRRTW